MKGYGESSYGDAFADVYDEWYARNTDVAATVDALASLADGAGDGPVLELAVGTGRIAIPLAARLGRRPVLGLDASATMLQQLRVKDPHETVETRRGDMVADLPAGPFALVFVVYNSFFNVTSAARQQACFAAVAHRLAPRGRFVIEAFVPESPPRVGDRIELRSIEVDRVVLSVSRHDADEQHAEGQYIEITESGGVRLRPWSVRYATPDQLDAMATAAGLQRIARFEDFAGAEFTTDSPQHVTVYGRE